LPTGKGRIFSQQTYRYFVKDKSKALPGIKFEGKINGVTLNYNKVTTNPLSVIWEGNIVGAGLTETFNKNRKIPCTSRGYCNILLQPRINQSTIESYFPYFGNFIKGKTASRFDEDGIDSGVIGGINNKFWFFRDKKYAKNYKEEDWPLIQKCTTKPVKYLPMYM